MAVLCPLLETAISAASKRTNASVPVHGASLAADGITGGCGSLPVHGDVEGKRAAVDGIDSPQLHVRPDGAAVDAADGLAPVGDTRGQEKRRTSVIRPWDKVYRLQT